MRPYPRYEFNSTLTVELMMHLKTMDETLVFCRCRGSCSELTHEYRISFDSKRKKEKMSGRLQERNTTSAHSPSFSSGAGWTWFSPHFRNQKYLAVTPAMMTATRINQPCQDMLPPPPPLLRLLLRRPLEDDDDDDPDPLLRKRRLASSSPCFSSSNFVSKE